jgi:hypothetical protein
MNEQELRDVLRQEMDVCYAHQASQMCEVVQTTVEETLVRLGMDTADPMAIQQDMHFLREFRASSESIKAKGVMALVGILVTATAAAAWIGIKQAFSPH